MLITKTDVLRSLIGVGPKAIGAVARIWDVPNDCKELKKKVIDREISAVIVVTVASLVLTPLLQLFKPSTRNNRLVQFIPTAIAYTLAEWWSRKSTNYNAIFTQSLKGPATFPSPKTHSLVADTPTTHSPNAPVTLPKPSFNPPSIPLTYATPMFVNYHPNPYWYR
jgi:hypothetical protein